MCEHPRCVTLAAAILVMTNDAAIYQKRIHKSIGIDDGRDSGGDGDGDGGGDEDEDDDGADRDGDDDGDDGDDEDEEIDDVDMRCTRTQTRLSISCD